MLRSLAAHRWGARAWLAVAGFWLLAGGAQLVFGSFRIGIGALVIAVLFSALASQTERGSSPPV